jgi:hypothetical protein
VRLIAHDGDEGSIPGGLKVRKTALDLPKFSRVALAMMAVVHQSGDA